MLHQKSGIVPFRVQGHVRKYYVEDRSMNSSQIKLLVCIGMSTDYREEVNTPENKRDLEFINLLRDLNKKRVLIDKSLKFRLNAFCLVEGNDEELINYTSWLKTLV